ncbi:MAG: hypothetical protein ACOCWL_01300 [Thermoguttaceae bacterium]
MGTLLGVPFYRIKRPTEISEEPLITADKGNDGTLTINGLAANALHDLAIFSQGNDDEGADLTLDGETKSTDADPLTPDFDEGNNYVGFSSATSNGDGELASTGETKAPTPRSTASRSRQPSPSRSPPASS